MVTEIVTHWLEIVPRRLPIRREGKKGVCEGRKTLGGMKTRRGSLLRTKKRRGMARKIRMMFSIEISSLGLPEPRIEYHRKGIEGPARATRPIGLNRGGKVREGWSL
jgi:hypothetical protein